MLTPRQLHRVTSGENILKWALPISSNGNLPSEPVIPTGWLPNVAVSGRWWSPASGLTISPCDVHARVRYCLYMISLTHCQAPCVSPVLNLSDVLRLFLAYSLVNPLGLKFSFKEFQESVHKHKSPARKRSSFPCLSYCHFLHHLSSLGAPTANNGRFKFIVSTGNRDVRMY